MITGRGETDAGAGAAGTATAGRGGSAGEEARRFPSDPAALNSLGLALHASGRHGEAVRAYEAALRLAPAAGAIYYNLGNALRSGGCLAQSIECYSRALALGTDRPEVHNNLGLAWQESGDWGRAEASFVTALGRDPRYVPAGLNLAYVCIQEARPDQAVTLLRQVLQLQPECGDAHWLLSHALLVQGLYEEGWREYEWRWVKMPLAPYRRTDPARRWSGGPIPGNSRILLYAEQGLGDAIQCIRYAPLVAARGGTVVVECQDALVSLLAGVDGVSEVHRRGDSIPETALECPLLSLPGVFGTTLATIPSVIPYLRPRSDRVNKWKTACGGGAPGCLRVGIVWAGSPNHRNDANRSVSFEQFAVFGNVEGVRLYSLQKREEGKGAPVLPGAAAVEDLGPGLADLEDTAAAIAWMDLVISVDTAVAHLAGAMGKPVLMLVPYAPDWRWLLGPESTPWYPTMRLLRQEERGKWGAVIARAVQLLREAARTPSPPSGGRPQEQEKSRRSPKFPR